MKISVSMITLNEERNIGQALASCSFADEIAGFRVLDGMEESFAHGNLAEATGRGAPNVAPNRGLGTVRISTPLAVGGNQ